MHSIKESGADTGRIQMKKQKVKKKNNRIMQTKKILSLLTPALLLVSCSEDKYDGITPTPGEDVIFTSAVQSEPGSRTIFADEPTGNNESWRINWLNGDMINVYTPQGASGFRQAPYKVVNTTADGADDNTLNYAKELAIVNPTGVRWGDAATANFYAVYPYVAGVNNFTSIGTASEQAVITADIAAEQVNSVPTYTNTSTKNIFVKGDMANNVMFACTPNVPNGTSPVDLKFIPAATVLQFKLGCLSVGAVGGTQTDQEITIRKITVTAPAGSPIAGQLNMSFGNTTQTVTPVLTVKNGTNTVSLEPRYNGTYVTIPAGGTMTANLFITVPDNGYNMGAGDWTIKIDAIEGTFTKTLTTTDADKAELLPGEIHQITLPKFNRTTEWTYSTNNWMSSLPNNIYVSELSLPGAWYCYDGSGKKEGYQVSGTSVTQLFNAGVRAFHIETRVGSTGRGGLFENPSESNSTVVISGSGTNATLSDGYKWATSIEQPVKDIATAVAGTNEFAVLVLNYADGGTGGVSEKWRKLWLSKLQSLIDGLNLSNLYSGTLSPNTTIKEVAGKLILLVCVDNENEENETAAQGINGLFAYTNFNWTNDTSSLISTASWKGWPSFANIDKIDQVSPSNIYLNYTLANRTYSGTGTVPAGMPNLVYRKDAIESLISNSDVIYGNASHNLWILCGAGGTYALAKDEDSDSNGPQDIASALNPFLLKAIDDKIANSKPSPLGLVLVNRITDTSYNGPELIQAIIEMNNKFYLQRDESKEADIQAVSGSNDAAYKADPDTWNAL